MPLGKFITIAGAVLIVPLALMAIFTSGDPDTFDAADLPAGAPLTDQPKEAKPASATPKAAEPKALFPVHIPKRSPDPQAPKSAPVPIRSTGGDRDCPDFGSQAEAQRFFLENGGPASDPHKLDRDHDGIACESN